MKNIILVISLVLITFSSCKKEQSYCGVEYPAQELVWVRELIKSIPPANYLRIYKNTYNNTQGFLVEALETEMIIMQSDNDTIYFNYSNRTFRTCDNLTLFVSSSFGIIPTNTFPSNFISETTYKELIYEQ